MKGRYAMGVCKPNALMPLCSVNDQQKILDVIASLHIADRRPSEKLVEQMGADELCRVLHAIRRWYTSNAWSAAEKVLKHVDVLEKGMDLRPPIGAYRGLKVDVKDPLARLQEGETVTIPVKRNGGCSSWTLGRALADRFSGSPKGRPPCERRGRTGVHCSAGTLRRLVEPSLRQDDGNVTSPERARVRHLCLEDSRGSSTRKALTTRCSRRLCQCQSR